MTAKLPVTTPKKLIKALEKMGFMVDHQTGSHISMSHPENPDRYAVIPFHTKDIKKGTMMSIIRQAGINKDELLKLL